MATGSRDAKLTLSVEALGQENITALEKDLRALAATGEEGAAEFGIFADRVAELGRQTQALNLVQQLTDNTEQLAQQQQQAGARTDELKANLDALSAATAEARVNQARLTQAIVDNEVAFEQSATAVKLLKADLKAGAISQDAYTQSVREQIAAQGRLTTETIELKAQLSAVKAEVTKAATAQRAAATEVERSATAYGLAAKALEDQQRALRMASDDATKLGVDVRNLAQAETTLQSALVQTVSSARSRKAAFDDMAEATRLYKIEEQGMQQLYARGEAALQAEVLALRDAARSTQQYTAAKAELEAKANAWQREAQDIVEAAQAALKASESADQYVAKLRELERINAWDKQAKDAEQLLRVRDYVRAWSTELDGASAKLKTVNDAFATLNVRPMRDIQAEIKAVNAALQTVAQSGQVSGRELATAAQRAQTQIAALEREARELNNTLTLTDKASSILKNSLGQIAAGNLVADGVAYLVERVKDMGREFIKANLDFERLQRTMVQITGSTEQAAQKIQFLRDVADTAGVAVGSVTDSFIKFQASASASGMAAAEVDEIFKAVTVAGSRMGMSSERVSLALDALGQIAGKSVVSMEELRQQLGDSLPGAVAIAAKGLNLTTSELTKLVETGQLSATEFFPAFRRGISETFGDADRVVLGLSQSFNRLSNEFTKLYQQAAGSTAFKVLGASVDALADNFTAVVSVVAGLAKGLAALKLIEYIKSFSNLGTASKTAAADIATQTAATTANTAATTANTAAKTANVTVTRAQAAASAAAAAAATTAVAAFNIVSGAVSTLATAGRTLLSVLGGIPGIALMIAVNAKELGTAIGETIGSWTSAGAAIRKYEEAVKLQDAALKASAATRAATIESIRAALQKEVAALDKSNSALAAREATAKKAVEAETQRNVLLQRTTDLLGQQTQSMEAAVKAAQGNVVAAQAETRARQDYVTGLEREIKVRLDLIAATQGNNEKAKEELTKLQELLATKREELKQSEATTQQLRIEAAERQIAAATYQDNSAKIGQFAAAAKQAEAELARLVQMEKEGSLVGPQLAAAQIEVAKATRLHADAIADYMKKAEARAQLESAQANLLQTKVRAEQSNYEAMARSAQAMGDYTGAQYAAIEAKRAEIRQIEISMEAKRREAIQDEEAAAMELSELQRTDDLTDLKRLELETRMTNARAKQAETGEGQALVKNLEEEIRRLEDLGNRQKDHNDRQQQNTRNMGDNISERERSIATREKEFELMEREMALAEKMREGSATMHNDLGTRTGIVNFLKAAGVTDDATARRIASEFADANGNVVYSNNPGQLKYGGKYGTLSEALMKAAETVTFGGGGGGLGGGGLGGATQSSAPAATPVATPAAAARSGGLGVGGAGVGSGSGQALGTRTVNVNIGGNTHSIGTASAEDSNTLVSMLRSLETNVNTSV